MERVINNLIKSNKPLMKVLRYLLVGAIAVMGIARLRMILILFSFPDFYKGRDIFELYLMAKAIVSGMSPYLPINELAQIFAGVDHTYAYPSPYPPFAAIITSPLLLFTINKFCIAWLVFELVCLVAIAVMLVYMKNRRISLLWIIVTTLLLLAWYTVQKDLLFGQFSILLTAMLLAAFISFQKKHVVLTGMLIGFTVAIKLITWPLIIYFALKKDWRVFFMSCFTTLGLNLITMFVVGIKPVMEYYLQVSSQVLSLWHTVIFNYSLWSIGYRLFEGMGAKTAAYLNISPPLINLPQIATPVSIVLVVIYALLGFSWALRSSDFKIAYAIMTCLIVGIAPVSWDHYYIMLIIPITVLFLYIVNNNMPTWQNALFIVILILLWLFNDNIGNLVIQINGGQELLQEHGYHISFASSLLYWMPILELIGLTILLWKSRLRSAIDHFETSHRNSVVM